MVEVFEVLEPTVPSSLSPSLTNPVACLVTNAKGYAADMFQNVAVGHPQLERAEGAVHGAAKVKCPAKNCERGELVSINGMRGGCGEGL